MYAGLSAFGREMDERTKCNKCISVLKKKLFHAYNFIQRPS